MLAMACRQSAQRHSGCKVAAAHGDRCPTAQAAQAAKCSPASRTLPLGGGDATKVSTVWKWVSDKSTWAFYSPLDADGGASYATSRGYEFLTTINGGESFWINARAAFSAQLQTGTAVTPTSFQVLAPGWHLISLTNAITPSEFNKAVSASPPPSGVVPLNFSSLWSWDKTKSKWYFYSPSLEAQGGTVLADYIAAHGLLDFRSSNKALGLGVGFWVKK